MFGLAFVYYKYYLLCLLFIFPFIFVNSYVVLHHITMLRQKSEIDKLFENINENDDDEIDDNIVNYDKFYNYSKID